MVDKRRLLGDTGEQLAAEQLVRSGLRIVARNWRGHSGELDLIAQEEAPDLVQGGAVATWLVLVEVRTRRGERFGTALQSITPAKQRKLRTVAAEYLHTIGWRGPWRIDVVAVQMDGRGVLQRVEHVRHAVAG